jgi:hypothetical protein
MTKAKIAITVSRETLAKAKKAVKEGRATSVSAFFESAVAKLVTREEAIGMLGDWLEESGGPATPAEKREAARALGLERRGKRGRVA